MNTIIVAVVLIVSHARAAAALCPASEWRASAVSGVQVRNVQVCK